MGAGIIAVEHPCSEQDTDDPAVSITHLLIFTQIDAVVKVLEDARGGVELHTRSRGDFDWEPYPVQQEQEEEDCDREAEVVLQELGVPNIGNQSEQHADCGEQPSKPAFVENGCIGV